MTYELLAIYAAVMLMLIIQSALDFSAQEISPEIAAFTGIWCAMMRTRFVSSAIHTECLIGCVIGFISFFLLALMGKGGGGDAVLMGVLGLCAGAKLLAYVVLFSAVTYIMQGIITIVGRYNKQDTNLLHLSFPYAPHVAAGWSITMALVTVLP